MTNTTQLEDGFYWVRRGTSWVIVEWSSIGHCFYLAGCMVNFSPLDFDEIDSRPIKRDNGNNN